MNQNVSVRTIDAPEFINLEPDAINPGIAKCEIKVFYLGKNRNGSYINKEVAKDIAQTLPGTPIVGVFNEQVEDFGDHGEVIHIEQGQVDIYCSTKPYGFVAPDAKVWFQKFDDTDSFGNHIQREYLMTTGYLWTHVMKEANLCISEGKGQSMELDEETLEGSWAFDENSNMDFFIINKAILNKLCILGDDVEPCFEGASVTAPEISAEFALNKEFSDKLIFMMNELKDALQNKGGSDMPETLEVEAIEPEVIEEVVETEGEIDANEAPSDEFKKEDEEEKKEDAPAKDDSSNEPAPKEEDEEKKKTQHALEAANARIAKLEGELSELRAYKLERENEAKDALFNKYAMLSEEDKQPLMDAKEKYSFDELEAKLALLYVQKNVDFSTIDGKPEVEEVVEDDVITTFSLDSEVTGSVPVMVELLRQTV